MNAPSRESLQSAIQQAGSAVELLRNSQRRAFSHGTVSGQFTNWQSEVHSWRDACGFMDQSHHMVDHHVKGSGAFDLLSHLAVNSFKGFTPGMAKQFVATAPDGNYLGDCVLFYLEDGVFNLVGRPTALDWVQYHVETGKWDVTTERDPQSMDRGGRPPMVYRYEVQGPLAGALMEKVTGAPLPDVKFFGMTDFQIAGKRVRALRHGMAGAVGFEIFGPWDEGDAVRDAILAAGEEFGLLRVGSVAYSTANLESGWVPGPLPAIFDQPDMQAYREWLPAKGAGSLAGSYNPADIADYYVTPFDLGYERIVKFDHDFVGSDALQERIKGPRRKKVTLVWDADDMARVVSSSWRDGPKFKYFNMPKARYGLYQMDEVRVGGQRAGISLDCGYLANERKVVSLAIVDEEHAATGTEVTVLWGENPNSTKPQVEPHEQTEIKAVVAPAPYGAHARSTYRQYDGQARVAGVTRAEGVFPRNHDRTRTMTFPASSLDAAFPRDILADYSLEITAKDVDTLRAAAPRIPAGTFVSVTFLPGETLDARIAATRAVRELGLRPMPHFSARRLASQDDFEAYLERVVEEAGVRRCFVVAGDPLQAEGPFDDSTALIATGGFERAGIRTLGVGGHPEGHPHMTPERGLEVLADKCRVIVARGMKPLIVTQFGFDAGAILHWLEGLRNHGVVAPVRIGVPGPAGVKTLLRFAARCGVGASASVLTKYGLSLTKLIGTAGPDKMVGALSAGLGPRHGECHLHFYPFGGLDKTVDWIVAYQQSCARRSQPESA